MEAGVNKRAPILLVLFSRLLRPSADPKCEGRNRAKTFWAYIVHGHIIQCSSCTLEVNQNSRDPICFRYLERRIGRLHSSLVGKEG